MSWKFFAGVLPLIALMACGTQTQDQPAIPGAADSAAIARVAGDKMMLGDVLRQSFMKGTLKDGLKIAMLDSALAAEIAAIVEADPRFADAPQPASSGGKAATSQRSTARAGQAKGDILDQTEQAAHKTNEKLDQAKRIRQQADEAKRKVEDIIKP